MAEAEGSQKRHTAMRLPVIPAVAIAATILSRVKSGGLESARRSGGYAVVGLQLAGDGQVGTVATPCQVLDTVSVVLIAPECRKERAGGLERSA